MAHELFNLFSTLCSRSLLSSWEVDELALVLKKLKTKEVKNRSRSRNQQQVSLNSSEIPDGTRALFCICYHYQQDNLLEIIQLLMEFSYVDLNRKGSYNILLQLLCNNRWKPNDNMKELSEIIDFLIQSGTDVNTRYGVFGDGENVLRSLINYYKGDSNIENLVKILLEKGVKLECGFTGASSELHLLFSSYNGMKAFEIAKVLIENGVDINAKEIRLERNPLHYLFKFFEGGNRAAVAKLLIDNGLNLNEKDATGRNVLHYLLIYYKGGDRAQIVQTLLKNGIDVNARGMENANALHVLLHYWKDIYDLKDGAQIAKLLIDRGIDVNAKDENGSNVLHYILRYRGFYNGSHAIEIVKMLLLKGIDIHSRDKFGRDALYYLSKYAGYDRLMMEKILGDYNMGIRYAEECVMFSSYASPGTHIVGKIVIQKDRGMLFLLKTVFVPVVLCLLIKLCGFIKSTFGSSTP